MLKWPRKSNGFTLVEVMVVAFILSLTAAGVLSLVAESFKLNNIAKENLAVREALDSQMELIRSDTFENLLNYDGVEFDVAGLRFQDKADTDTAADDPNYHQNSDNGALTAPNNGRIRVVPDDTAPQIDPANPSVYKVTLEVYWRGVIGNRFKIQQILIANDGADN